MTERLKVTVADGKYTVIQHENGSTTALRYGEPWPAFEHGGVDNLHLALAYEVDELREELASRTANLEAALSEIKATCERVGVGR